MTYLNFTYDRNYRQPIDAPSLPEEVVEQAYEQFKSTGLDSSEWLTWRAQFTQVYLENAMPTCPKCCIKCSTKRLWFAEAHMATTQKPVTASSVQAAGRYLPITQVCLVSV